MFVCDVGFTQKPNATDTMIDDVNKTRQLPCFPLAFASFCSFWLKLVYFDTKKLNLPHFLPPSLCLLASSPLRIVLCYFFFFSSFTEQSEMQCLRGNGLRSPTLPLYPDLTLNHLSGVRTPCARRKYDCRPRPQSLLSAV